MKNKTALSKAHVNHMNPPRRFNPFQVAGALGLSGALVRQHVELGYRLGRESANRVQTVLVKNHRLEIVTNITVIRVIGDVGLIGLSAIIRVGGDLGLELEYV